MRQSQLPSRAIGLGKGKISGAALRPGKGGGGIRASPFALVRYCLPPLLVMGTISCQPSDHSRQIEGNRGGAGENRRRVPLAIPGRHVLPATRGAGRLPCSPHEAATCWPPGVHCCQPLKGYHVLSAARHDTSLPRAPHHSRYHLFCGRQLLLASLWLQAG